MPDRLDLADGLFLCRILAAVLIVFLGQIEVRVPDRLRLGDTEPVPDGAQDARALVRTRQEHHRQATALRALVLILVLPPDSVVGQLAGPVTDTRALVERADQPDELDDSGEDCWHRHIVPYFVLDRSRFSAARSPGFPAG